MLKALFRRPRYEREAHDLYVSLVQRARSPIFFNELGIPDTPEGRFEVIVLHAFLLIHRLNQDSSQTSELSQQLFDVLFGDMDSALREMGVGDVGVGKRLKKMVQSFYGRAAAYEEAVGAGGMGLKEALQRNLYGLENTTTGPVEVLEAYVNEQIRHLSGLETQALLEGKVEYGPPPQMGSGKGIGDTE